MDDFIQIVPRRAIVSPCVNICTLDPATGLCRGCGRTGDEIARWTAMSDAELLSTWDALAKNGWTPALMTGKEFDEFVEYEFSSLRAIMYLSGMV